MSRDVVLMDVDGVLCDFTSGWRPLVAPELAEEDISSFVFEDYLNDEQLGKLLSLCESAAFWAELKPYEGARDFVESVSENTDGGEIVYCTAPWVPCDGWAEARRIWLKEHMPKGDLVVTKRKDLIRGDYLIDDKPENVLSWAARNKTGIGYLYERPWNRGFTGNARMSRDAILQDLAGLTFW